MSRAAIITPDLRKAYAKVFGDLTDPAVRAVLLDLKRLCQVPEAPVVRFSDGSVDAHNSMMLIGKQEVFNRIRSATAIDDRALFNLSAKATIQPLSGGEG